MKPSTKVIPILALVLLVGCDRMNHTEQNALGGIILGAGAGALIGSAVNSHGAGTGALIGAGVGLLSALIYDQTLYSNNRRTENY